MESLWAREYRELKRLDAYLRSGTTVSCATWDTAYRTGRSNISDGPADTPTRKS